MSGVAVSGAGRPAWWVWAVVGLAIGAAGLLLAWATGAFAPAAAAPGTCYRYADLLEAADVGPVACEEPHTGQAVGFFAPSLDTEALRDRCREAVGDWLGAAGRTSRARSAHVAVLVEVHAPWRRSGVRCDVVRAEYPAQGGRWTPGLQDGSSQGALERRPAAWAQCRRLVGSQRAATVSCRSTGRRGVDFEFQVRTKGRFTAQKARAAVVAACSEAARGEVTAGADPVRISSVDALEWKSGRTATGTCTFRTRVWKHASR